MGPGGGTLTSSRRSDVLKLLNKTPAMAIIHPINGNPRSLILSCYQARVQHKEVFEYWRFARSDY